MHILEPKSDSDELYLRKSLRNREVINRIDCMHILEPKSDSDELYLRKSLRNREVNSQECIREKKANLIKFTVLFR